MCKRKCRIVEGPELSVKLAHLSAPAAALLETLEWKVHWVTILPCGMEQSLTTGLQSFKLGWNNGLRPGYNPSIWIRTLTHTHTMLEWGRWFSLLLPQHWFTSQSNDYVKNSGLVLPSGEAWMGFWGEGGELDTHTGVQTRTQELRKISRMHERPNAHRGR